MAKYCKDCKFYKPDRPYFSLFIPIIGWLYYFVWWAAGNQEENAQCLRSPYPGSSWKKEKPSYYFCSTERVGYHENDCGPTGKHYEANMALTEGPYKTNLKPYQGEDD